MRLSEALETVGKSYTPGVAQYYDRLEPNPWLQAHEDLERVALLREPDLIPAACERFVSRALALIARFTSEGKPSTGISNADAVFIGDPERIRAWQSRKEKHCIDCESKEGLTLTPAKDSATEVVVICRNCLAKRPRSA